MIRSQKILKLQSLIYMPKIFWDKTNYFSSYLTSLEGDPTEILNSNVPITI